LTSAKGNQEPAVQTMKCIFFFYIINSVYPFGYNLLTISYWEHSVTILNYEQTYWHKYLPMALAYATQNNYCTQPGMLLSQEY